MLSLKISQLSGVWTKQPNGKQEFLLLVYVEFSGVGLWTKNPLAKQELTVNELEKIESFKGAQLRSAKEFGIKDFNPNTIAFQELRDMGIPYSVAKAMIGYREKVKPFKVVTDVKKVYGMSDSLFTQLEDYITLPKSTSSKKQSKSKSKSKRKKEKEYELFQFNPNKVSSEDMEKLGFSSKQIKQITNYRSKGGRFYKPEDLEKIYAVSEKDFKKWENFIVIEVLKKDTFIKKKISESKPIEIIDINMDEAEKFIQIPGIGEKLSARIIKYRDKLGGFHSIEQLKEVYGIDPVLIDDNRAYFEVSGSVAKIKVNEIDIKTFIKHPYIDYNSARRIVNYREVHGLFTTVDEIKANDLVKDEVYDNIVYYLTAE